MTSLLQQDYTQEKYRVIVIDDGSTDGTVMLFNQLRLPKIFSLIGHTENRGLAAARNTGIQNAPGEILIFLDSDMEVASDFISRHVSNYSRPEVFGVVSELQPAPENPYDKYQRYLYESRRGARVIGADRALPFQYFIFGLTSIRRSALEKIGIFDADIRHYGGEDTEMAYRLWRHYPDGLFYAPDIVVTHHHYRPFSRVLQLVENFGRQVVPYLAEKHPPIAGQYGTRYLKPHFGESANYRFWIGRLWRTDVVFKLLWFLYEIMPYPLSNLVVRGLLASALLRGVARA